MLMLLKERSKVGYKNKDRKKFKAYMPDDHIPEMSLGHVDNTIPFVEPTKFTETKTQIKKIVPKILEFGDEEMKK